MERKIYMDNAATTPMSAEVINEMMSVLMDTFGNPSSLHSFGREAKKHVDTARDRVANALHCDSGEIYFTSGATESNNWALTGIAKANRHKGNHIITSKIEHPSVIQTCKKLEKEGFSISYLDVDEKGLVRIDDLLHCMRGDTILISIMTANNEVGTIQNLQTISNIAKEKGVLFHTDATQAIGAININVHSMGIDALSLSGHKINGPKGIGALYLRDGVVITPFMNGGEQEMGMRAGTLNVAGIVGLGKAIELATVDITNTSKKIRTLRDYFINRVMTEIEMVYLNGHAVQRLPNNINLSFGMVDGESLMYLLDMDGVAVSMGSACSAGSTESSYVLKAMGIPSDLAKGAIRFSISRSTTKQDVDYVVNVLKESVEKLRKISAMSKSQVGKED